jgi:hypothetical protein
LGASGEEDGAKRGRGENGAGKETAGDGGTERGASGRDGTESIGRAERTDGESVAETAKDGATTAAGAEGRTRT